MMQLPSGKIIAKKHQIQSLHKREFSEKDLHAEEEQKQKVPKIDRKAILDFYCADQYIATQTERIAQFRACDSYVFLELPIYQLLDLEMKYLEQNWKISRNLDQLLVRIEGPLKECLQVMKEILQEPAKDNFLLHKKARDLLEELNKSGGTQSDILTGLLTSKFLTRKILTRNMTDKDQCIFMKDTQIACSSPLTSEVQKGCYSFFPSDFIHCKPTPICGQTTDFISFCVSIKNQGSGIVVVLELGLALVAFREPLCESQHYSKLLRHA